MQEAAEGGGRQELAVKGRAGRDATGWAAVVGLEGCVINLPPAEQSVLAMY